MALVSRRTKWIKAFNDIIPIWQETKEASGGLQAMQYGKNSDAGCNNGGMCSAIVMPSFSDFVVDVEINARRALEHNPLALRYFMARYRDVNQQLDDVPRGYAEFDLEVRELVGKRLLAVGVAPLSKYRKAMDTR